MSNAYEEPIFEIETIESAENGDFNPADACVIVGAIITGAAIYAASKC